MSKTIFITEVGLRDGLQSLKEIIPTSDKLFLTKSLVESGVKRIQVTSFVNKKLIPQMADAEKLICSLSNQDKVEFSALVLNQKGLYRAIESGIKSIDFSVSSSESYSKKNTRMNIKESMQCLDRMIKKAKENNLKIRAGIQCVWGCNYDGFPNEKKLFNIINSIAEMEPDMISLADSTGMANPSSISYLIDKILNNNPNIVLNLHLHNTMGLGLANLCSALSFGIYHYDTSFGGIGGSPFIKGSSGNIATEDTVYLLEEMGYESGINKKLISKISLWLENKIGTSYFEGKIYKKFR